VATNRGLERAKVAELANGLSYVGTDALELGLIDELGDLSTAREHLENVIGEKVELCWY
jgi:ClpP class serine protease